MRGQIASTVLIVCIAVALLGAVFVNFGLAYFLGWFLIFVGILGAVIARSVREGARRPPSSDARPSERGSVDDS